MAAPSRVKCLQDVLELWSGSMLETNHKLNGIGYRQGKKTLTDATGRVVLETRIVGKFTQTFDLRKFPFDTQALKITLAETEHSWKGKVTLEKVGVPAIRARNSISHAACDSMPEWTLHYPVEIEGVDDSISATAPKTYTIAVNLRRKPQFHLLNVFLPYYCIIAFALLSFAIPQHELNNRLILISSSMLTTVAFKFVVQQGQPALPYLTMMDVHMLVGFVFLLFLATSVALVHVLVPEEVVDAADGWNFCGAVVVMLSVCTFFVFQAQVALQAGASKMASQDAAWDGKPTLDQAADLGLQKGVYTEMFDSRMAESASHTNLHNDGKRTEVLLV